MDPRRRTGWFCAVEMSRARVFLRSSSSAASTNCWRKISREEICEAKISSAIIIVGFRVQSRLERKFPSRTFLPISIKGQNDSPRFHRLWWPYWTRLDLDQVFHLCAWRKGLEVWFSTPSNWGISVCWDSSPSCCAVDWS